MNGYLPLRLANLTECTCPPDKREIFYWDQRIAGFGLRCHASGRRLWIVQYRTRLGRSRRVTLGAVDLIPHSEARKQALDILARVRLGQDPQGETSRLRKSMKVIDAINLYLTTIRETHKPRTIKEMQRVLLKHVRPLHPLSLNSVTRSDIVSALDSIEQKSGPNSADRARSYLSSLWNASVDHYDGPNPVSTIRKRAIEVSRDRVLTADEIARLWTVTNSHSDFDRILRLLLLTGARRDEVGRMRWEELNIAPDRQSGVWIIPAERTKNSYPLELPLGPLAIAQLPPCPNSPKSPAVFGRGLAGFSGWSRCKSRLDHKLAEISDGVTPWRLHDLRRTFSTWLNELGTEPHIVEAMLNHLSGSAKSGVAGVYNRATYRTQKKTAAALWEAEIVKLKNILKT